MKNLHFYATITDCFVPKAMIAPVVRIGVLLFVAQVTSTVIAQPMGVMAPVTVTKSNSAQVAIDKEMARLRREHLLKTRISLDAKNATLDEIVDQIKTLIPDIKTIEIRRANPVRLTFAFKDMPAAAVLEAAATLAGCRVFYNFDHTLVAPLRDLTPEERTQWIQSQFLLNSLEATAKDVASEIDRRNGEDVHFGSLSLDSQGALLRMVARLNRRTLPTPTPDSVVSVSSSTNSFDLVIDAPPPPQSSPRQSHQYRFIFQK